MTSGADGFGAVFGMAVFAAVAALVVQVVIPREIAGSWERFFYSAAFSFALGVAVVCLIGAFAWVSMKLGM